MTKFISVLGSVVFLAVTPICGCSSQSDSDASVAAPAYELTSDYTANGASLKVTGYGDWTNPNANFAFEYYHDGISEKMTVNFEQWISLGDTRPSDFFAHMDSLLLDSALGTLRETHTSDSAWTVFNHFQTRLLSSRTSHVHTASELSPQGFSSRLEQSADCYCSYCKIHHPPQCL